MSPPTHDHDRNPRRLEARVEQLPPDDDDVQSLPPVIAGELLHLYEHHMRCRAADAPNTTWELPVSGLQDLQPTAASGGSHL
jgi:hypothetical protein